MLYKYLRTAIKLGSQQTVNDDIIDIYRDNSFYQTDINIYNDQSLYKHQYNLIKDNMIHDYSFQLNDRIVAASEGYRAPDIEIKEGEEFQIGEDTYLITKEQMSNEYLPNEYYEPTWIQPKAAYTNQVEMINTGITHTPNTKVQLKIMPRTYSGSYNIVFGARNENLNQDFALNTKYSGTYGLNVIVGKDSNNRTRIMDLNRDSSIYSIEVTQSYISVSTDNGEPVITNLTNTVENTGSCSMKIWDVNWNNRTSIVDGGYDRIYYLKIYEDNTLVRDFRPAINKSTGQAGLYDLVEQKLYETVNTSATTNYTTDLDPYLAVRNSGIAEDQNLYKIKIFKNNELFGTSFSDSSVNYKVQMNSQYQLLLIINSSLNSEEFSLNQPAEKYTLDNTIYEVKDTNINSSDYPIYTDYSDS